MGKSSDFPTIQITPQVMVIFVDGQMMRSKETIKNENFGYVLN